MSIRRKLAAGVMAGVLGVTALAGTAFAWDNAPASEQADAFRDRVAEILGVERTALDDAMAQARAEQRDAQMQERLTALVEAGTVTQAQADEITAWLDSRPAILGELAGGVSIGRFAGLCGVGVSEARLEALVEAGTITQEQAGEITAWLDARPAVVDELLLAQGQFRGHFRNHHGRGGFGLRGPEIGLGFGFGQARFRVIPSEDAASTTELPALDVERV